MPKVVKRTYSLTAEQAAFIDRKVASGEYASGSEVVRNGLREMQEHDAIIDRWIREEVVPTHERWKAGLEKAHPIDEVFERIYASIEERAQQKAQKAS
jgi:antitoxin ParD1/3/4